VQFASCELPGLRSQYLREPLSSRICGRLHAQSKHVNRARKLWAAPRRLVFPSAKGTTPLGRDNTWRELIAPLLKDDPTRLATFQIMRRTHVSLSRQASIDPKLVADQLGYGLGVNLDVYTVAALDQRQHAVQALETTLIQP
jgi:hypothetical protein